MIKSLLFYKLVRWYLKRHKDRDTRLVFQTRKLKAKHHQWLYFNTHPWESK